MCRTRRGHGGANSVSFTPAAFEHRAKHQPFPRFNVHFVLPWFMRLMSRFLPIYLLFTGAAAVSPENIYRFCTFLNFIGPGVAYPRGHLCKCRPLFIRMDVRRQVRLFMYMQFAEMAIILPNIRGGAKRSSSQRDTMSSRHVTARASTNRCSSSTSRAVTSRNDTYLDQSRHVNRITCGHVPWRHCLYHLLLE